jgi:hypothetical protein
MSLKSTLFKCSCISIAFLAGCGDSPSASAPPAIARPELQTVAQKASETVAKIRNSSNGSGNAFAPVVLFEERHDLRAVQVQEALAMVRMHDQFGMKDIALEGYLKDEGPVDTSWMKKASGAEGAGFRARAVVSLLHEGEISSAEFMKLVYDDVQVHAIEDRANYDVSVSDKAESAPFDYLMAIAEKSLPKSKYSELQAIDERLKSLPKGSPQAKRESRRMVDTILSGDAWAKGKYDLLNDPVKSQALSGEEQLALAEEIQKHAQESAARIGTDEKEGLDEYIRFWRGRMAASQTMVAAIGDIAKNPQVALVAGLIGAFHTSGMSQQLGQMGVPYAVLRPFAMDEEKTAGSLGNAAFERKYARKSVFTVGLSKQLMGIFPAANKKPQQVLQTEWFQAKSETYLMTDRIVRRVLGTNNGGGSNGGGLPPTKGPGGSAGPPPGGPPSGGSAGSGGAPPQPPSGGPPLWGFSDDDLNGKRARVDPRRIEIVPAAPGSKRNAVLFPIVLNPDDPARRKELWVKAALTKDLDDRKSVEDLLRDALQDIVKEPQGPREQAEDRRGRIQVTEDVHAAVSATRQGALSVALGV